MRLHQLISHWQQVRTDLLATVDKFSDDLAVLVLDFFLGYGRVFHHVVQQRSRECGRIEAPLHEDLRHRDRMRNVRFTGHTVLTVMRALAEFVGALQLRDVFRSQVCSGIGKQNSRWWRGCRQGAFLSCLRMIHGVVCRARSVLLAETDLKTVPTTWC